MADIVFFDDAATAVGARGVEIFVHLLRDQHVFGFVAAGRGPSGRAGLWAEGLLGPVIHEVPDPRGRPAEVRVALAAAPTADVPAGLDGLARKRAAIWHNAARNDAVAAIAGALAEGRPGDLRRFALPSEGDAWPTPGGRPPRVAVLVESPEHGRALAGRLPGWSGRPAAGAVPPAPDRAILTLVHAASLRRLDVDALVRADGGPGPIALAGFPPRRGRACGRVLLIDVADEFDAEAAAGTRRRLRGYRDRGWDVEAAG